MPGPQHCQQHTGNHEAFPIFHAELGHTTLPPLSQNGLALGRVSLPHGTKHRICWGKLFVSNQEHCFFLERLHPAWRDFGCSWMGWGGWWGVYLGNGPSWGGDGAEGAMLVAWGQPPIAWLWPGVRGHHSALAGAHMAALHPHVHTWVALPHACFVSPVWSCGKGSPSLTAWHCILHNPVKLHHMCLAWGTCTRERPRLLPLESCSRQDGRVMGTVPKIWLGGGEHGARAGLAAPESVGGCGSGQGGDGSSAE